jgi:hypothetical protein
MAGYEDGGTPSSQQVSAAKDAYVVGRDGTLGRLFAIRWLLSWLRRQSP